MHRLPTLRSWLKFLAGLLAVTAALDAGARALEGQVPETLRYYHADAQVRVQQLRELEADGTRVDIVFAGTSMTRSGIDPIAFTQADPQHRLAYNAALSGASPYVTQRFLLEEVVPRVHPKTVVLGFSSLDFYAGKSLQETTDKYRNAPATDPTLGARFKRATVQHLALYRQRTHLRNVGDLRALICLRFFSGSSCDSINVENPLDRSGIAPLGRDTRYLELEYDNSPARVKALHETTLGGFRLTPEYTDTTVETVRRLRGNGINVVFVDLPVTADYIDVHPRGEADYRQYQNHLRRLARDLQVPLIDATAAVTSLADFANSNHPNGSGSAKLTRFVAERLPNR